MVVRALRLLAAQVSHRPRRLLLVLVVPCVLLGLLALRAPVDLTFLGLLNRSHPEVARYLRQSEELGLGGTLLLLLRAPEGAPATVVDRAVEEIGSELSGDQRVAAVVDPVADGWLARQLPWLLEADDFDGMAELLLAAADGLAAGSLSDDLSARGRRWLEGLDLPSALSAEGERVLQVLLREDPMQQALADPTFAELAPGIAAAVARAGALVEFSGLPAVAYQDQAKTLGIIRRLSPISLALVLLLVVLVERRPRVLAAVVASLLLAVAATVGVIGVATGRLTLMETFFGVTVFGLGIDFAIHLLLRLREERDRGASRRRALERALTGTGRGILAGALTTAGAFLVLSTAPDPVPTHLGLSGGLGLLFCLALMLGLVPVAWSRAEKGVGPDRGAPAGAGRASPVLSGRALPCGRADSYHGLLGLVWEIPARIARSAVLHPRLHLAAAALLAAIALAGLPRFELESRIERVFNRDVPAVATVEEISERFGVNGAPWVIGAESLEEAERIAERLRTLETFASVSSPTDVVSLDRAEMERRRRALEELPLDRMAAVLGAGVLLGPAPAALPAPGLSLPEQAGENPAAALLRLVQLLREARGSGPPEAGDLPPALALQFRGLAGLEQSRAADSEEGPWIVRAHARESTFDARRVQEARLAAQAVAPEATGLGSLLEAVLLGPRPWLGPIAGAIVLFVVVVLSVDLRSPRQVLLALVPVTVGSLVTFGALCWLPSNFNVMTLAVVPLLVGLGVDDGIHVVHRMREGREPVAAATASVGRAILMTTATTCASFAVLLFTNHPGLESMALVMLIGLPLCFLASVSTLPAAARWLLGDERF